MKKISFLWFLIFVILSGVIASAAELPINRPIDEDEEKCTSHVLEKVNISSPEIKPVNNDKEYHNVIVTYDEKCKNCNEIINFGKESTEKEMHSFKNDICEKCSFSRACTHAKKSSVSVGDNDYEIISDDVANHLVIAYKQEQCDNCKEFIGEKTSVETKAVHEFENDKCTKCGYVKPENSCTHKSSEKKERKEPEAISGNAAYHNLIIYLDEICTDECKQLIKTEKKSTEPEEHKFNDNNICEKCNFKKDSSDSELTEIIKFLKENNIMVGDENGNFNKEDDITRAEFSKIVSEYYGENINLGPQSLDFNDVSSTHWSYEYVIKVNQAGLMVGYGNNIFGINDTLTEEQAITVLCRMLGDTYEDVSYIETNADEKGGYSEGYISIAGERGIDIEAVQKAVPATRGRVAKWLYQLYNIKNSL